MLHVLLQTIVLKKGGLVYINDEKAVLPYNSHDHYEILDLPNYIVSDTESPPENFLSLTSWCVVDLYICRHQVLLRLLMMCHSHLISSYSQPFEAILSPL